MFKFSAEPKRWMNVTTPVSASAPARSPARRFAAVDSARVGTTHVLFEPLDFIARLAALVPRPRRHLVRYHGVLAPNARHRHLVVPAPPPEPAHDDAEATSSQSRAAMSWAQRLRRVFALDISRCPRCGGQLRVLAVITDPRVIAAILAHIELRAARAPPPVRH